MANDVTLEDVAHRSGVSRATASRALNNREGVREDVRERVHIIARAMDYRPNRSAKNLAGGRASVIGLVLGRDHLAADPYATNLLQEVAKAAESRDEGLMILMDSEEPSIAVRNLLSDGLVDGVIVSIVAIGARWVEELLDAKLPVVLVGAHPRRSDVPVVDAESLESSAKLVGLLLDTGCERVGTITGPIDRVDALRRLEGFRLAHERRSLAVDESLIVTGDFTRQQGYDLSDHLLDQGVDGIFAANDEMALGVLSRAAERGLAIPEDLSVTGFDGTSERSIIRPRLTTANQPFAGMATQAVETLLALITNGPTPSAVQLLDPTISFGETTRPDASASINRQTKNFCKQQTWLRRGGVSTFQTSRYSR